MYCIIYARASDADSIFDNNVPRVDGTSKVTRRC